MIYALVSNREKRNDDFINPRGRVRYSARYIKFFHFFSLSRREIWIRASSAEKRFKMDLRGKSKPRIQYKTILATFFINKTRDETR